MLNWARGDMYDHLIALNIVPVNRFVIDETHYCAYF